MEACHALNAPQISSRPLPYCYTFSCPVQMYTSADIARLHTRTHIYLPALVLGYGLFSLHVACRKLGSFLEAFLLLQGKRLSNSELGRYEILS